MKPSDHSRTILTLLDYYEPGYKAGGPITTIKNSIAYLSDRFIFKVVTSDRDLGDDAPYPLPLNQWIRGEADTMYLTPDKQGSIFRVLRETAYDILYLNSFFSFRFSILPVLWMRLKGRSGKKVIVAPRGEFSRGALSIKPLKKKLYIGLTRLIGLYEGIIWQASSEEEKKEIALIYGPRARVTVATDLPSKKNYEREFKSKTKRPGRLNLVFLSRISKMKNLAFALASLREARGDIRFDIYGPLEDADYWAHCEQLIAALPPHIKVSYKGAVRHEDVNACLAEYDLFYLPTLGEGFGHAVFEALQAACPVLLSNRTPWNDIAEKGGGLVYPLEDPAAFTAGLQQFVDMSEEDYNRFARRALEYSRSYMEGSAVVKAHVSLFE